MSWEVFHPNQMRGARWNDVGPVISVHRAGTLLLNSFAREALGGNPRRVTLYYSEEINAIGIRAEGGRNSYAVSPSGQISSIAFAKHHSIPTGRYKAYLDDETGMLGGKIEKGDTTI